MLEYAKVILPKLSFSEELFQKELIKCINWVEPFERDTLQSWVFDNFSNEFPEVIEDAGKNYNPSILANYTYEMVKEYNQFYHDYSILKADGTEIRNFRLVLSVMISKIVKSAMTLLGVELPERM